MVSHAIYRARRGQDAVLVESNTLRRWLDEDYLPRPPAQLDALLLWLGQKSPGTGEFIEANLPELTSRLGVLHADGVAFLLKQLIEEKRCETSTPFSDIEAPTSLGARLTVSGWRRFDELMRGQTIGVGAFMAMPFGVESLDLAFAEALKPGAAAAGFDLIRLDEAPTAGIIDVRLRNEIRTAAFLVADLTNANPGAYWEAGFAEGLGKPVIYTCEQAFFDEHKTHFDTNHCHTVTWSAGEFEKAAADLAAVVRNTLPEKARFTPAEE